MLGPQLFNYGTTVNFRRGEGSCAAFHPWPNERNHLLPCPCHCAVTRTQPHAAKPHGRDFKTPCSEIALLHCDYSFVAKSGGAGREWHSAVSELLVIHSKDTECRSGRAFPILPILCLILSYVPILCTV